MSGKVCVTTTYPPENLPTGMGEAALLDRPTPVASHPDIQPGMASVSVVPAVRNRPKGGV